MKVQIVGLLLLCNFNNAYAYTKTIAVEFLKRNVDIQSTKYQLESAKVLSDLEENKRDFVLSLSSEYSNSTLKTSPSSYYSLNNKIYTNTLSLSKETILGSTLSLSGSLMTGEYAGVDQSGYSQTLSLKQDLGKNFFGRNSLLLRDSKNELYESSKLEYSNTAGAKLLIFLTSYMQASLSKSVVSFQEMALERSQRRLKLISKQVRDGVKERADLFSAQTGELYATESLRSAKSELDKNVEKIRKFLHRKVDESEIEKLSKIDINLKNPPKEFDYKNNHYVKSLQQKFMAVEKEFHYANNNVTADVSLMGSYTTNNFDKKSSKSFSDGTFGSDNREFKVGLEVSLPFGLSTEKANKSLALIKMLDSQNQIKKAIEDVEAELTSVISQYNLISENLKSATQRVDLAKKALDEYNKLYNRGRASLDQVINAEERLIETQISMARYEVERNVLSLSLFYLNSTILTIVN
ncbi:outer membrane efflux protein [Bacteriovorax sp. BSW11_IV]|uniref:TolC family protein n=1 Tax=Bacteriovorax sp. BSW11_IV TaxID=1353529 RepID=UPI00038A4F8B|nr:TolC family protein [Bacteriovorax sp. BSW11_IV]EQC48222.1 outer membrane efflux protein [Bacteriovorax sp. BSW11_IV]